MKTYRPTTPSRRHMTTVSYRGVVAPSGPHKALTYGRKRAVGRASSGRISVRHKGGGHKRVYREIDFLYDKFDILARIKRIEYDPNRSGFIALVCYADGERRYVLAPAGLKPGDTFIVSEKAEIKTGNRLPLKRLLPGTFVYNVEIHPRGGARLARSAGIFLEVQSNDAGYTNVKLPSGEVRKINENCFASIGTVSNEEHKNRSIGKAGRSRWLGIRPTVRGSAMNPVDHPYGGGEGRSGRGLRRAKSMWGKPTGGVKSRRPKKYSKVFIIERRKNARDKKR